MWNPLSIKEKFLKKEAENHFPPAFFIVLSFSSLSIFLSTLSSSSSFLFLFYRLSSAVLSWAFSLFSASFFSMVIIKQSAVWHFIVCVCTRGHKRMRASHSRNIVQCYTLSPQTIQLPAHREYQCVPFAEVVCLNVCCVHICCRYDNCSGFWYGCGVSLCACVCVNANYRGQYDKPATKRHGG